MTYLDAPASELPKSLSMFLSSAAPMMEAALKERTKAFEDWTPLPGEEETDGEAQWDMSSASKNDDGVGMNGQTKTDGPVVKTNSGSGMNCIGSWLDKKAVEWNEGEERDGLDEVLDEGGPLTATGVSWSSTGGSVAVSFGRYDHRDWCTHKGVVGVWSAFRRSGSPDGAADTLLDMPGCAMSVAAHPVKPGVIAAGSFHGEVRVWNLNKPEGEQLIASTRVSEWSHREPVSRLEWIVEPRKKSYLLASVAGDGRVLAWTSANKMAFPVVGYHMSAKGKRDLGVMAAAWSKIRADRDAFVLGTEGGGVYRCTMAVPGGKAVLQGEKGSQKPHLSLPSPIAFSHAPHTGPVMALDTSPFNAHVYASGSSDGTVRVWSALSKDPVFVLEAAGSGAVHALAWSPWRPLVLAVGTSEGLVQVWDFTHSRFVPAVEVSVAGEGAGDHGEKTEVTGLTWSPKSRHHLATTESTGRVRLWRMASGFSSGSVAEEGILTAIAEAK